MCDLHQDQDENARRPQGVSGFVDELTVALTNSRIYSQDHPRVQGSIDSLTQTLRTQFDTLGTSTLLIGAADGYLFYDHRPLLAASRSAPLLLSILARLGAGGLSFARETDTDDLSGLVRFFSNDKGEIEDVAEANEALTALGCRNVHLLAGYQVTEGHGGGAADFAGALIGSPKGATGTGREHMLDVPKRLHQHLFDHLTNVTTHVVRGDALDLSDTHQVIEGILTQLFSDATSMLSVTHYRVSEADQFQFRHSIRVACVALDFARGLTDDQELLHRIGTAALLHDVGKARVPFEVLHCKGRLSKEQFAEMELHPEHGARILLELTDADPLAITVSFMHHRRADGGGYPNTLHPLAAEQISLATRIAKICDVYEALTGYRPYRDPISPVRAFRTMISMGDHFDQALLHRFIRVTGIYPAGTYVELASGDVAVVETQTGDLCKPVIVVKGRFTGTNGSRTFESCEPLLLDPRQVPDAFEIVQDLKKNPEDLEDIEDKADPAEAAESTAESAAE